MQPIVLNLYLLTIVLGTKRKVQSRTWLFYETKQFFFFLSQDPRWLGFVSFSNGIVHIGRHFVNFQEKYFDLEAPLVDKLNAVKHWATLCKCLGQISIFTYSSDSQRPQILCCLSFQTVKTHYLSPKCSGTDVMVCQEGNLVIKDRDPSWVANCMWVSHLLRILPLAT